MSIYFTILLNSVGICFHEYLGIFRSSNNKRSQGEGATKPSRENLLTKVTSNENYHALAISGIWLILFSMSEKVRKVVRKTGKSSSFSNLGQKSAWIAWKMLHLLKNL